MKRDNKQKKESKKTLRRKNVRLLAYITGTLILILCSFIWYNSLNEEDYDLSSIGQGENVVVQIHDPG